MNGRRKRRTGWGGLPGERGSSYVAVLVLVAALSATALAFVNRVAVQTGSAQLEWERSQADYMACAAVNHAMWRLVNDATFVASADPSRYVMHDYTFHSIYKGRYGYMVRPHTSRTFATIAAIGIFGDAVAERRHVICLDPSGYHSWP